MISENVVVMTRDEFEDRLEAEFRRGMKRALGDDALLEQRAALSVSSSGVVYSTDGGGRIRIGGAIAHDLGDCLTIQWMNEVNDPQNQWFSAHFSPARARLVARLLTEGATMLEEKNGLKPIDPIPEVLRKGPVGHFKPR